MDLFRSRLSWLEACNARASTISREETIDMSLMTWLPGKHPARCAGRLLVAGIAAMGALACDSNDEDPSEIDEPPPIPEDDVAYIDFLAPHHQDAIQMADEEISRGGDDEVVAMASDMKEVQLAEIDTLQRIRVELAGSEVPEETLEPDAADPHMTSDMGAMEEAAGADLDRAFLWHMVPHHASAVVVSHRALPNLENAELRSLAEMTIIAQTREMNAMLDMLGE
jgi:uncharacterized protein (DUF305 family)